MPPRASQWVQQGGCMRLVHRMALDLGINDLPSSPHAYAHTGAGGSSSVESSSSSSSSSSGAGISGGRDATPVPASGPDLRPLLLSLLARFSANPHTQTRSPTAAADADVVAGAAAAFVKGDGGGNGGGGSGGGGGGGDGGGEGEDGRGQRGIHGQIEDVMWDELWEQLSLRQQGRQGPQLLQQQQQQQGQQQDWEQGGNVSNRAFSVNMSLQANANATPYPSMIHHTLLSYQTIPPRTCLHVHAQQTHVAVHVDPTLERPTL
ncbi:unnamed protein product [Closterium sp. NIES-64]|nr:unnamed protein product [Closterium sp. NIES-64]